ncbi:MAG: SDR family oxidoreductase [Actinobacteria bacterium]|nr:SDR family oxidoreductase [Actinomycetota bacterium]MBV9664825.1 SDR family oxidoreductase [Actinomycetota bacterium]MBV9936663.1 SDR family oxidoreductase [Actinomycetota bacterium]
MARGLRSPPVDDLDFTGQVVLVTGGSRGIGRGIAARFVAAGAHVVVCGRTAPEDLPGGMTFETADVRDADQVGQLIDGIVATHGRLDVVVNNAGGSPHVEAADASPRFSTSIVALNLLAPLFVATRANAVMQQQDPGGNIINIGSLSGLRPSPGTAAYGAAKAGLINLTESLAMEWAPKVRVNCVSAGMVRTEQAHLHFGSEAGIEAAAATVPLGRMAEPDDVANLCLFVASPLAANVSGSNFVVHGGGERPPFHGAVADHLDRS